MRRLSNRSPSNAALFALAEVLHHPYFPEFIRNLQKLTYENFQYVQEAFKDITRVEFDGPNVFIFLTPDTYDEIRKSGIITFFKRFGIEALLTESYMERNGVDPIAIRLNVEKDKEELEPIINTLRNKITNIQKLIHSDSRLKRMISRIPWELNTPEEVYDMTFVHSY